MPSLSLFLSLSNHCLIAKKKHTNTNTPEMSMPYSLLYALAVDSVKVHTGVATIGDGLSYRLYQMPVVESLHQGGRTRKVT